MEAVAVVQRELEEMQESGEDRLANAQIALAAECAVRRSFPTVFCCRRHTPLTAVIRLVAVESRTPWKRLMEGRLGESDFLRLTLAAGRLGKTCLGIVDCRQLRSLALPFDVLPCHLERRIVILDWAPPHWQWHGLQEMAKRHSLNLLFPRT